MSTTTYVFMEKREKYPYVLIEKKYLIQSYGNNNSLKVLNKRL